MVYMFLMLTAIFSFHSVVIPSDSSTDYLSTARSAISDTLKQPAFWLGAATATATTALFCNRLAPVTSVEQAKALVKQATGDLEQIEGLGKRPTAEEYSTAVEAYDELLKIHHALETELNKKKDEYSVVRETYEALLRNRDGLQYNYTDLLNKYTPLKSECDRMQNDIDTLHKQLNQRPTIEQLEAVRNELTAQRNSAQQEAQRRISPSRLDSLRAELAETQKQLAQRPTVEQLEALRFQAERATTLEQELQKLKASLATTANKNAETDNADQSGDGQATE